MKTAILFLRQIIWPLPTSRNVNTILQIQKDGGPLPAWVDNTARIIGLILTLFGSMEIAGIPLIEWVNALLNPVCS